MKRHGNLWPTLTSFEHLLGSSEKAKRGKRFRPAVARYEFALERELWKLREQLLGKTYRPGNYRSFYIYEPKKRLICAAPYTIFRDNLGGDSAVLNGNGSGAATVVQADSALWKQNFASSDTGSSTAVPEPSAVCLLILGAVQCRIASGLFR